MVVLLVCQHLHLEMVHCKGMQFGLGLLTPLSRGGLCEKMLYMGLFRYHYHRRVDAMCVYISIGRWSLQEDVVLELFCQHLYREEFILVFMSEDAIVFGEHCGEPVAKFLEDAWMS